MKGKSSINLTSLVEFEHHSMADTIRNENEEKKIKVKAPVTAKKNKQHQTSNCDISVTSAAADLKFLLCVDLVQISLLLKFQLRGGTGYGDIDFKAYSMILGGFRGNPLKIRVLRSCSENLVQLR